MVWFRDILIIGTRSVLLRLNYQLPLDRVPTAHEVTVANQWHYANSMRERKLNTNFYTLKIGSNCADGLTDAFIVSIVFSDGEYHQ